MAETEFTTSHALAVQLWSVEMFKYPMFKSFFSKYIGKTVKAKGVQLATSSEALLQLKVEFRKQAGWKVTFPLRSPFRSEGVAGDDTLEGKEEALTFYDWSIELKQTRNAAKSKGKLSDKRVRFNAKNQAKEGLGEWLGNRIDNYNLCALSGVASGDGNVAANVPSNGNRKWTGGQTAAGALNHISGNTDAGFGTAANELFGPLVIEAVRRKAKATEPVIRPIVINGKEYYVMFIHPLQSKSLKATTEWKNIHQHAGVRGDENPIFSGMLGIHDGVILHEWEKIETRLGEGGSTASEFFDSADDVADGVLAARALFCGAQAVCNAYGDLPSYDLEDFDYKNKWGVAVECQVGAGKPEFNGEDYGVIAVDTQVQAD